MGGRASVKTLKHRHVNIVDDNITIYKKKNQKDTNWQECKVYNIVER